MLKHQLIHPKINEILGRAGHHAKILLADGNYPASSKKGPNAELVCLNLSPGIVTVAQVLAAVASAVPIEAANTMGYEKTGPYALTADPPVWDDFRRVLAAAGLKLELKPIEKVGFLHGGVHAGPRADDADRRPAALRQPAANHRRAHGLRGKSWNAGRWATRA